jgi:hypothetical protein
MTDYAAGDPVDELALQLRIDRHARGFRYAAMRRPAASK